MTTWAIELDGYRLVRNDYTEAPKLFPDRPLAERYARLSFGPFNKRTGALVPGAHHKWKVRPHAPIAPRR